MIAEGCDSAAASPRDRGAVMLLKTMTDERHNDNGRLVDKLVDVLLGLPWPEVLGGVWKIALKAMQGRADRGLY